MNFRKLHPELFYKSRRHAMMERAEIYTLIIVLTVAGVGIYYVASSQGYIKTQNTVNINNQAPPNSSGCLNQYTPPSGFTCTALPVKFTVSNPIVSAGTSTAIASATVVALDPVTLASAATPATTDSTGATTTSNSYTSGTSWICKVTASTYTTLYFPCTVPAIASGSSTAITSIILPLYTLVKGTYQLTAQVQGGSSWSNTFSTYSFANSGTTSVTVTWSLNEINNNQGYISTYQPLKKIGYLAVLELQSASSPKTTVTGCQLATSINNVYTCQYILPDGYTTINTGYTQGNNPIKAYFPTNPDGTYKQTGPAYQTTTIGSNQCTGSLTQQYTGVQQLPAPNGGQVNCQTTFQVGSLSAASENWTVTLYFQADPVFYDGAGGGPVNGNYGGDQASQTLSPSWSTVTLKN